MGQQTVAPSPVRAVGHRHRLVTVVPTIAVAVTATLSVSSGEGLTVDTGVAVAWALLALMRIGLVTWGFDRRYPGDAWSIVASRWAAVAVAELFLTLQLTSSYAARADTTAPTYGGVIVALVLAALATGAAAGYRWWTGRTTSRPSFTRHHLVGAVVLGAAFTVPLLLFAFLALFTGIVAAAGVLAIGGGTVAGLLLIALRLDERLAPAGIAAAWGRLLALAVMALVVFVVLLAVLEAVTTSS